MTKRPVPHAFTGSPENKRKTSARLFVRRVFRANHERLPDLGDVRMQINARYKPDKIEKTWCLEAKEGRIEAAQRALAGGDDQFLAWLFAAQACVIKNAARPSAALQ